MQLVKVNYFCSFGSHRERNKNPETRIKWGFVIFLCEKSVKKVDFGGHSFWDFSSFLDSKRDINSTYSTVHIPLANICYLYYHLATCC